MEMILNLFKKREHGDEYEFTDEDFVFKHDFKRYYVRKVRGAVEFWARSCLTENISYFIGNVINDKVVLSRAFYTLPYEVQRAAGRLIRIYLHNDDRWI